MLKDMLVDKGGHVPVPARRTRTQLDNGTRLKFVEAVVRADLNITGAGGTILNRGSVLAALELAGISMDGKDRIAADPRALKVMQERFTRREYTAKRAANPAIGVYKLEESLILFGAMPQLMGSDETALLERATGINVDFFTQARAVPLAGILKGGVATLDNLQINVAETYDLDRHELPYLRPFVYELSQDVVQANKNLEVFLRPTAYVGAITIQQETDDGEVSDIVNTVQLIADGGKGIIPFPTPYQDLVMKTALSDDYTSVQGGSYLVLDFMGDAKLSRILNPLAYPNLRFRFDCQPSVGKTGSKIRITLWTFEQDAELTQPIPFAI